MTNVKQEVKDEVMEIDADVKPVLPKEKTPDEHKEEETLDDMETAFVEPSTIDLQFDTSDLSEYKIYEILQEFYGMFEETESVYMRSSVWKTAAFTIQAAETLLRLDGKPLLGRPSIS